METKIRILHLESLKADTDEVARELKKQNVQAEIQWVKNRKAYTEALDSFHPDLVLSDHTLPSISYYDAFRLLKEKTPDVPFILVTGTVSEEHGMQILKEGIDDFIIKDRLKKLPLSVLNVLTRKQERAEKNQFIQEISGQEKRFRALIEHSREAIVLRDKHFNLVYRSPFAEKINGWTDEELRSTSFVDHIHPDDRPLIAAIATEIPNAPGKPFHVTYRSLHKNGSYIWIDMTITNLLDDENVRAFVFNFRDITEQRTAEQNLVINNNHFKALIENISDAIVLTGRNGKVKYNSPAVQRITGFTTEEGTSSNFLDHFHPDDLPIGKGIYRSIVAKPEISVHETFRIQHKNGQYIWVEASFTNLLKDESVKAIVISYKDITARRQAEQELEESAGNLRSIFDNTNISYVLVDRKFQVVSFNHLAKERYRLALNVGMVEGAYLLDYLPEHRRAESFGTFKKVLSGEKQSYEISFGVDDEVTWYNVNIFPVYGVAKNIIGLIISSEDITSRKRAELEREKMTADLIQHNKNLEQFAYIISHNLRAPVANIIGLSTILNSKEDMDEADFKRCLEGVTLSVKKLDEVIRDLSQILQTRREVNSQRESVNFSQLLSDIKTITSELIEKENIHIDASFEVPGLYTVKSYLHSIFLNLITNSIKYRNPSVQTVLEISSRRDKEQVVLRFRDNGLGIDLKTNGSKLFGLYKRFHHHIDGKGMGLYMVKTQIEMLGGNISIDSTPGKGTEFEIRFGLMDEPQPEPEP